MVNRKGEDFSSFIKADLETGRLSYSRTPDGFDQREEFKIPEKDGSTRGRRFWPSEPWKTL